MSATEHFATLALAKNRESRSLALYLAYGNPDLVVEAEQSGLLKKGYFSEMMDEFADEGEECFCVGCTGMFQNEKDPQSGGCSCHLGMVHVAIAHPAILSATSVGTRCGIPTDMIHQAWKVFEARWRQGASPFWWGWK